VNVAIAGRMLFKRVMGKASFASIQDMSGRMQLYISNDQTGADAHETFKHWDLGDILAAEGSLFKTKTGELSVRVARLRLLTSRCGRCRRSFTASPTRSSATASATST